ncbi:MAG TPA: FtsX-like permease family protein, partial [Dehalococcoidia bacterium]|nr:FtsX-like permease family protein [Dehalococcoidia bacterium]
MKELFGLPIETLMLVFTGALALIALWSLLLIVRQPVLFRMAARNIPRRSGRSMLIVLGLTLATTIITSALATGDTVGLSARSEVLQALGNIDEVISSTEESDIEITGESVTLEYFDESAFDQIRATAIKLPQVDGVMPAILEEVGAQNPTARQTEPRVAVIGVDARYMSGFLPVRNLQGQAIDLASLQRGEVLLNREASEQLQARPGDEIILFVPGSRQTARVRDVIDYDGMGSQAAQGSGLLMSLSEAQALFGKQGQIKHIVISNSGDSITGARHTNAVIEAIEPALARLGLAIEPTKRDDLQEADDAGAMFSTIFITFGSFSIAAGILLIFLLFVMLAAERKPEMGIARAVGTERVHLVEMFMFEGVLYDVVAAAVGALVGVGVALAMISMLAVAVEQFGIELRFAVSTRSLITGYAMGVVLTFVVVTASAWRVSLLNIVTAIRNLPEPVTHARGRASLIWGVVFLALGAVITWAGLSSSLGTPFYLGVSLLIFAAIPFSRAIGVPDRLAFTVAGGLIVVLWLLPWRIVESVTGELGSDINIWVVGGLITVIGITWLVMYNSDLVVIGALASIGRVRGLAPILKMALTYPLTNRFRTGVTLSMFTLVVFTLVVGGTVTTAFTQAFNDVQLFGGGFDIRASTVQVNPIDDLRVAIKDAPALNSDDFAVVADQSLVPVKALQQNTANEPGDYPLRGLSDSFFDHTAYGMAVIAEGYETPEQVWQAVKADASLAVVDSLVAPRRSNFGFGAPVPDFKMEGFYIEDGRMKPTKIEVRNPLTSETFALTVIGVLPEVIPDYMIGITTSQRFVETAFPEMATPTAHLIS